MTSENATGRETPRKGNFPPPTAISIYRRARGRRGFCLNGAFWGLGNGLVSTSLVIYLVNELTAASPAGRVNIGVVLAWVIAAPRLIGLLRLFAPTIIDVVGSRKRVAFWAYFLSPLFLLSLPLALPLFSTVSKNHVELALWSVGLIWAVYHLVEYFGTVTLWSWLGDFLTPKIRPLFLARRQRWMIAGQFFGASATGLWTWLAADSFRASGELWRLYLYPVFPSVLFLLTAAFFVLSIPEIGWTPALGTRERFARLLEPLRSRRFLAFLLFASAIQVVGGLGQSPQNFYQAKILLVPMIVTLGLTTWTKIGQLATAGLVGRLLARFGNRRVMAVSLGIVSTGSLFYAIASPDSPGWIFAAASVWIGWIGVNLGIANLLLALSPPERRSDYVAVHFTVMTLAFGLSTMVGGRLFDLYRGKAFHVPFCSEPIDYFRLVFILVAIFRMACLLPLIRPNAIFRIFLPFRRKRG